MSRFERNVRSCASWAARCRRARPLALDPRARAFGELPELSPHPGTSPKTSYKRWRPSARDLRGPRRARSRHRGVRRGGEREAARAVVAAAGNAAALRRPRRRSGFLSPSHRERACSSAALGPMHLATLAVRPSWPSSAPPTR
jgi:hypothetical protein